MKKIFLFTFLFMICFASSAFAYFEEEKTVEGADITGVKRLSVAAPFYTPTKEAPPYDEFMQSVAEAFKKSKCEVIGYDDVADRIKADHGTDIKALDRRRQGKAFRDYAAEYADAYVVITVTMSRRTVFFFDVKRAGTNELLYAYEVITENDEPDTAKTYTSVTEAFFKAFDSAAASQRKEQKKAAKKKEIGA